MINLLMMRVSLFIYKRSNPTSFVGKDAQRTYHKYRMLHNQVLRKRIKKQAALVQEMKSFPDYYNYEDIWEEEQKYYDMVTHYLNRRSEIYVW